MLVKETLRHHLLAGIERDTESLSLTNTHTTESTVYGLNTVSGRAIMAVGNLAIQAVERMNMMFTLRRIASELLPSDDDAKSDVRPRLLEDLLELQR